MNRLTIAELTSGVDAVLHADRAGLGDTSAALHHRFVIGFSGQSVAGAGPFYARNRPHVAVSTWCRL